MAGTISARDRRLETGWQFREIYRLGHSYQGVLMSLVSLSRPDEYARVGYVASRRVGGAVKRNRAKRLLRESYRAVPSMCRALPRWRVWIARQACASASLVDVSSEMLRLLEREAR